ncbi:MAG: glycosyltransferase family 2 protein [Cytophagales bacterium]
MNKISIIIPCYFNEENIPVTSQKLIVNELLFDEDVSFEYVMVDDGSKDNTLDKLLEFKSKYPDKVKVIKLAGNVGSYNAIVAGMEYASGDCNVVIAADLQDPPELMVDMYKHWKNGFKLVIGSRSDREETWSEKIFSNTFHYLMKKFAIKNVPSGGFDYVMFDKIIKNEIVNLKERNTNIFYLMTWMGFTYVNIPYVRKEREIGVSRWTLSKKIKLLVDSFVSFSFLPLRFITVSGLLFGFFALIYAIFIIMMKFLGGIAVEGWSAIMIVILVVSSFQMIALGILGEYIWRTLDASKKRPLYFVEKTYLS